MTNKGHKGYWDLKAKESGSKYGQGGFIERQNVTDCGSWLLVTGSRGGALEVSERP